VLQIPFGSRFDRILRSAAYDAALDEVMLTPRQAFALTEPVQILVGGDPNGRADRNIEAVLRRTGVTLGKYAPPSLL
jgi:hypothetical protein